MWKVFSEHIAKNSLIMNFLQCAKIPYRYREIVKKPDDFTQL